MQKRAAVVEHLSVPELPSLQSDYFEFFGLERKLNIDLDDLQKRFYALSRQLHPDRYTQKSAAERQYSLDATAILNDAYRTLRDPLQRVEYVLKYEGFDIGEQKTRDVPPELLEEVFELNMAIEEADRPQLEAAAEKFSKMLVNIDDELTDLSRKYDQNADRNILAQIRSVLNRRRYVRNLVRDVEKALTINVHLPN
jgi:molecular chaperone HscB